MSHLELRPGQLTWHMCQRILQESELQLSLQTDSYKLMEEAQKCVERVITEGRTVYGVNTGFGLLANTRIAPQELELLQRSIVLSHAAGVGAPLQNDSVRLILALKINSLGQGYSGVRREITDALLNLFNHGIYPVIPEKGSVGASGDLAPLAHLAAVLIGEGEAQYRGEVIHGNKALSFMGIQPITLAPKEGLALLNGTQVSTALAIQGLLATQDILRAALVAGAFSVEAAEGSRKPFDPRIQAVRRHPAQITVARLLCNLLAHSEIEAAHADCSKVQDPYSLRCQPQVMGACLAQLKYAAEILLEEANGVSDNPLIFAETNDILSGGNFHAEPVAFAADALAVVLAEIGSLSERRIALLIDKNLSGLPPFLVENGGVNSGFMIAQVTAAALVSENKTLAFPTSVDSIPTSANQEDHVSMATHGARRLLTMAENTANIVAIELLAAAQGLDFRRPLRSSPLLEQARSLIRSQVAFYDHDRYFAPDIVKVRQLIMSGSFRPFIQDQIFVC